MEVIGFRGEALYGLGRVPVTTYLVKLRAHPWAGGHIFNVDIVGDICLGW